MLIFERIHDYVLVSSLRISILYLFSFTLCPSVDLSFLDCFLYIQILYFKNFISSTVFGFKLSFIQALWFVYVSFSSFLSSYCFVIAFITFSLHLLLSLVFYCFDTIVIACLIALFVVSCWFHSILFIFSYGVIYYFFPY